MGKLKFKSVLLILSLFLLSFNANAQSPIQLKLATFEPPKAFFANKVLGAWAEKVNKESNGRLEVKVFAGGVLGSPPQQYDNVTGGVSDIAWTVLGYIGGQFPLSSVIELPFMTKSAKSGTYALNTLLDEGHLDKEFSGVKVIGLHSNPPYQMHFREDNITKPEQFKGKKMRVPSAMVGKILKKLGATGVRVPAPGTFEALQKGVLDGTPFPYSAIGSFRLGTVTKYHTEINVTNATFGLLMNKEKYNSLPDDLKKVIDNNSGKGFYEWVAQLIDYNNSNQRSNVFFMDGHQINVIKGAELDKYKSILAPLEGEWLDEMNSKGLKGNAVLKRAKEVIASIDK